MYDKPSLFTVPEKDLGRHDAGPEESWQESWGFSWHDPLRRAGGINHISIWRNRGVADVWSWAALDGKVIGKYQNLRLPVPEQDFPNWTLGGQRVTTYSGRSCRLEAEYEKALVDLHYESHTDPLTFSYDVEGSTWGGNHYESIGRVHGTVRVEGETVSVSGFAWQDHSWGPRRWADTQSHRWLVGEFGPDLFLSAIQIIPEQSPVGIPIGYVYDKGSLHKVIQASFGARVGDDGHSPLGCDARIWTDTGHGYRITGDVHTASPSSHDEGMWFTDGLAVFECGGRLGSGIFEIQELRGPAQWHKELLLEASD